MAQFEIVHTEGVNYVKATLEDETIRAERGALFHMKGRITMRAPLPGPRTLFRSLFNQEAVIRPSYTGTGVVCLEPSLGGFHAFELGGETWILEAGTYWASDGSIDIGVHREGVVTSYRSGEGLFDFQTKVKGDGQVVLTSDGPVHEVSIDDERVVTGDEYVLARTSGVSYRISRAAKGLLGIWTSGEGYVRTYAGTGRLLVCPCPYWRQRLGQDAS